MFKNFSSGTCRWYSWTVIFTALPHPVHRGDRWQWDRAYNAKYSSEWTDFCGESVSVKTFPIDTFAETTFSSSLDSSALESSSVSHLATASKPASPQIPISWLQVCPQDNVCLVASSHQSDQHQSKQTCWTALAYFHSEGWLGPRSFGRVEPNLLYLQLIAECNQVSGQECLPVRSVTKRDKKLLSSWKAIKLSQLAHLGSALVLHDISLVDLVTRALNQSKHLWKSKACFP